MAGQSDQKTDDMMMMMVGRRSIVRSVDGCYKVHTHNQDKYQHQQGYIALALFASYVLGVTPDRLES